MLVLLCSVRSAILLALARHAHVALSELWQPIARQLSLQNCELQCALSSVGIIRLTWRSVGHLILLIRVGGGQILWTVLLRLNHFMKESLD